MNLVAKEFVSACEDESGVLILSRFTGASHEFSSSLLVNPYDVEGTAEAIHQALTMLPEEKKERMRKMRQIVREYNIYRWAADMITALIRSF
jgi:trehalose 6-phosphate synthase